MFQEKKPSTSKKKKKDVKSEDILKRGMSLVKSYSKMTEDERKELIKKAFEAKAKLQKELKETKDEVKKKEQEVEKLTKEVKSDLLMLARYIIYAINGNFHSCKNDNFHMKNILFSFFGGIHRIKVALVSTLSLYFLQF